MDELCSSVPLIVDRNYILKLRYQQHKYNMHIVFIKSVLLLPKYTCTALIELTNIASPAKASKSCSDETLVKARAVCLIT